jgi:hypothetical protein
MMPSTRKTMATIERITSGLTRTSGAPDLRVRRALGAGVRRRVADFRFKSGSRIDCRLEWQ